MNFDQLDLTLLDERASSDADDLVARFGGLFGPIDFDGGAFSGC